MQSAAKNRPGDQLRVISGKFKGQKLVAGGSARPLTDRVKTVMFDLIGPNWENSIALDCYAGSGAFGIEALSRGAKFAYFFESDPASVQMIEENLEKLAVAPEQYQIISTPLPEGLTDSLTKFEKTDEKLIVLFDPPFTELAKFGLALHLHKLAPGSTVCLRLPPEQEISGLAEAGWSQTYTRKIGISTLHFLVN